MEFAATLQDAMRAEKLTLQSVGQAIGLAHTTIARWTAGALPDDPEMIARLSALFPGHWPRLLVWAYLTDLCPSHYRSMLRQQILNDHIAAPAEPISTLAGALRALESAAARNADLRRILIDLAKLAEGL